ncbi:MAG: PAS domain S-box protein [Proteobacteria bacterium]|nr:PAS domain S-box protein [Pseudomonadota bacterium]MBU1585797.1 PAS domain S-box protein [Pseudomonadota bacterium]MBU2453447.1 PAS domain S-box protein [Pseudomonadota bacterium]MBU2630843.1 PAS domain S-box protein [Pseudomonadota bacterium]
MASVNWSIIFGIFSFIAGIVSASIAIYLSPHWKNKSARILMLLMVAVAAWSFTYGMEFISPNMGLKLWWVKAEYFGAVWISMLLFSFILTISGKKWQLNKTGYAVLSIVPLAMIFLVLTNNEHHLIWRFAWLDLSGKASAMAYIRGPGFWGFVVFSYSLLLLATFILIQSLISARGIFRKQLVTVLVGVAFPWVSNIIYLFGFESLKFLDLTPVAFTIGGIAFSWGLLRYQMLSLIPLARETLIDSMGDPVIALDMNDRILDVNRSAQTLLKINQVTPAHNTLKDVFPILHDQVAKYRHQGSVEVEISFGVETLPKQWNFRLFPLLGRKEKHIGWLIILRDITSRKKVETALKESERIHRIILEASPNPIVFYNEIGEVTYLNPAFKRVFGWSLSELLGKRIDFVPEENWEETKKALQNTYDQPEGNHNFITRRYTKAGDILDVSINSAFYRSKDGSPSSMVVNFTDITKIKKTERELINTKNFIRSIINSMPSILIGLNTKGCVMQWNAEAERLTGVLAHEAEGCLLKDVFPQLSGHISNVRHTIEKQTIRKEAKVHLAIGSKVILTDITMYPIISDGVQGAVIRVDDISERVRIEEMMVQSEKMLSVGGLAAGMAHEINNPLAGILQNIQVIQNRLSKDLPANLTAAEACGINLENLKAYMEKRNIFSMMELVRSSGHRAAQIVENMLSFSRKSDHRKSTHYLHDIMDATIELIKSDYSMKKQYDFRSIEIVTKYQENVPPVNCEKSEIQQVFLNLLKNGAEAMTDAGISSPRFTFRYFRQADQVVFEIEDNGPGIDQKTKKRIFEPFFTTKDVGVGTGLGLSVSYFIITENHKGVLSAESTSGKGTTFIIKLPIKPVKNTL